MNDQDRTAQELLDELEALRSKNRELELQLRTVRDMHDAAMKGQERFRIIIENVRDLVCELDFHAMFRYLSPSCEQILGYAPQDLVGESVFDRIHPEDRVRVQDEYEQGVRSRTDFETECRYRCADGHYVWFGTVCALVHDAAGNFTGAVISSRDITRSKEAAQALVDSEQRFRTLSEASFEGIAFSEKGVFVDLSDQVLDMLGYTRDELIGESVLKVIAPESRDLVAEAVRSDRQEAYEHLALRKDGSKFHAEARGRYAVIGGKRLRVAAVRDITERKLVEEALRKSEERLRLALEGTTDGIWDWHLKTGEVYFSQRWYTMLGYEADEFPAGYEIWRGLLHPHDVAASETTIRRAIRKGIPYAVEFRMKTRNGSWMWILSRGKVVEWDTEGNPLRVAGSHSDITERKRLEEALEKRIVALTQPLDAPESIAFEDLLNLAELQSLQDLYAEAFGVAALITRPDGTPITQPSNFCSLCADIIRKIPEAARKCRESDATVGRYNPSGPNIQNCLSAGLCNAGASITVGGHHVANWLIGQVRNETQDEEQIMEYCRAIGADETAFLAAYRAVPVLPQEQFEKAAQVLFAVANQISTGAYQNIQQARFIADYRRVEETSQRHLQELGAINSLGRKISSKLSLDDIVHTGLQELVAVIQSDCAMLFLRDGNQLMLQGLVSSTEQAAVPEFPVHRVGECLCGLCVEARKPLFCRDTNDDPRCTWEECKRAGVKSIAAIPLVAGDEVIGVLCLGSYGERDFSVQENFIQSLAYEMAMALKNSLLYEEVRKHALELEENLSELKRANEERESLQGQLVQAQKMEAVGILSGGIAHDFNNLLQVIQGYADLLLLRTETGSQERSHVREIKRAIKSTADLTQGLLTFSRRIESELRPTDVNHEVRRVVRMLKRTIPKMIAVQVNLEEPVHTINADPSQLQQVLMNLGVNAKDSMPEGGRLVIQTRNLTLDEDYCRTHLGTKPGDYVMLSVSDTGSGMESKTKERIFDPFFTTKAVGEGTGLGLSVVYGIIKNHGGTILCYSEPGQGTTFKIYFPAVAQEVVGSCEPAEAERPARGTESVLIIDDEEKLREALAETLRGFGYRTLTASNGREGIDLFRESPIELAQQSC